MDFKRLITVDSQHEAEQVLALLTTHGIPAQIMQCPDHEQCEAHEWIVSVYEADYVRAGYVLEEQT
jgi:type III secretory pathway lipoprotein EscJ